MSITKGPNLGILINGNQGEAHYAEVLEFFRWSDTLTQARVKDKDLTAPPGSPTDGDAYIVAASPTGAWSGKAGQIARWWAGGTAWEFRPARQGWRVHVEDEAIDYRYESGAWVAKT